MVVESECEVNMDKERQEMLATLMLATLQAAAEKGIDVLLPASAVALMTTSLSIFLDILNSEGVERIGKERVRQIEYKGSQHHQAELTAAAVSYAKHARLQLRGSQGYRRSPFEWPWEESWWKPSPLDPIRNLEKAGALIAAEIDRLLAERKAAQECPSVK